MTLTRLGSSRPQSTSPLIVTAVATLAALATVITPATARADDSSTLTVVGTSDVSDSNLVDAVIKPGFEAYEQQKLGNNVTLNYLGMGTGKAIAAAEAGTASALLVHAASAENQFVGSGYSYEQYGRAIFYGDYVLVGPPSDPAGVFANDPHDIVGAFERIAAAGAAGTARFVSRGGNSGTTIQEHQLWALTHGVTTCNVDANPDGGGQSPSTTTGDCTNPISYPSWYTATGGSQSGNLDVADACNGDPTDDCYAFTDRGTFQYLESQTPNTVSNLHPVTRGNLPSARGGAAALTNYYHAYAVNPNANFGTNNAEINLPLAEAFLNWLTSAPAQEDVNTYLNSTGDAPFLEDAAPKLSVSRLSSTRIRGGRGISISGKLTNTEPYYPPLAYQPVTLTAVPTAAPKAAPTTVALTSTDSSGDFSMDYIPRESATYSISTGEISQVENSQLNPVFGDLLSPTTTPVGTVTVDGGVSVSSVKASHGKVTIAGHLAPGAGDNAHLSLYGNYASRASSKGLHYLAKKALATGADTFHVTFPLTRGHTWLLSVHYVDARAFTTAVSATRRVTVP